MFGRKLLTISFFAVTLLLLTSTAFARVWFGNTNTTINAIFANTSTIAGASSGADTNATAGVGWSNSNTGIDVSIFMNITTNASTSITNFNVSLLNQSNGPTWGPANASFSFVRWNATHDTANISNLNFSNLLGCYGGNSSLSAFFVCNSTNLTGIGIGPNFTAVPGNLSVNYTFTHNVNMTLHFRASATGNYTLMINVTDNTSSTANANVSVWFDIDAPRVVFTTPNQSKLWPESVANESSNNSLNLTLNLSVHALLNDTGEEAGLNITVPSANVTGVFYRVTNLTGTNFTAWRSLSLTANRSNKSGNWSTVGNIEINTSGYRVGGYNITVNATDEAGNWNTTSFRTFYINRSENASFFRMWSDTSTTQYVTSLSLSVRAASNTTCKYNTTASQSDFNNGGVWMDGNGTLVHTASWNPASDGSHTVYFVCGDNYNNFNTTSVAVTRDTRSQVPPVTVPVVSPGLVSGVVSSIAAGTTGTVAINSPEVTTIEVAVISAAANVQVSVQKLDAAPATITAAVTGTVYKYLDINAQNLAAENVNKSFINFKVDRAWMTNNNLSVATVRLNRWENTSWRQLTTTQTGEDSAYYHFKAESPGLSIFAVTAGALAPPVIPPVNVTPNITPNVTTPEGKKQVPAAIDWTLVGIIIAIVVIVAAAVFFLRPKKYPITGR